MKDSRVTISVNGKGDGFITPTRGLRQGCPMSPYLFIIAMEFLAKLFQARVQQGDIRGVRLAKTAPTLTHILYADDLVVMGQASMREVTNLKRIFDTFAQHSGLAINPDKSTIWFSRGCEEEVR